MQRPTMDDYDGQAHYFLKIPSFGTLVVEIPYSNDHASHLYKIAAAAMAEKPDFFGEQCQCLGITSNGMIVHDSNESLKDMGIQHGATLECFFAQLGGAECCGRYLIP
jgi:hypothetical protein